MCTLLCNTKAGWRPGNEASLERKQPHAEYAQGLTSVYKQPCNIITHTRAYSYIASSIQYGSIIRDRVFPS